MKVWTGADRLAQGRDRIADGKRIGLLTNPTGITSDYRSTIDVCAELPGTRLTALFACEHGIRGERQAGILFEDETDAKTGLPVYSLYGTHRKPTADMLRDVDAIVFDIQDLGVRFYTYLTTLVYVMQACAEHDKEVIVLDRPNPTGGYDVEGGYLEDAFHSMVGAWRAPYRTGLTVGEYANLVQSQMEKPCKLHVVSMEGWDPAMEYPDTGLPWLLPSPNMPTMDTVRVYAGNCLFEGTNLSEGRGTTKPFEMIGAPWLQAERLANRLNSLKLPGAIFHPITFTPMFSKHQGALCHGLQLFVTDRDSFKAVSTSLHLLHHLANMHEEHFVWLEPQKRENSEAKRFIDILSGSDVVRHTLGEVSGLRDILERYKQDELHWREIREPFLIYERKRTHG